MEYVIEISEDKHELIKMAAAGGIGDWVYRIVAKGKPLKQEPKTGHWKDIPKYRDIAWCCSECERFTTMKHNYCPKCGAKMVEPQESEVEDDNT